MKKVAQRQYNDNDIMITLKVKEFSFRYNFSSSTRVGCTWFFWYRDNVYAIFVYIN